MQSDAVFWQKKLSIRAISASVRSHKYTALIPLFTVMQNYSRNVLSIVSETSNRLSQRSSKLPFDNFPKSKITFSRRAMIFSQCSSVAVLLVSILSTKSGSCTFCFKHHLASKNRRNKVVLFCCTYVESLGLYKWFGHKSFFMSLNRNLAFYGDYFQPSYDLLR